MIMIEWFTKFRIRFIVDCFTQIRTLRLLIEPSGNFLLLNTHTEEGSLLTLIKAFIRIKVLISLFMAIMNPAASGPFIASLKEIGIE